MSDQQPPRRHPNVINANEAPTRSAEKGTRFGFTTQILGAPTGGKGIGASLYEIPPGRAAFPAHYHCANEEAAYILEGEGSVRIGEATIAVAAGDYVTFPVGPEHAHQILNTGAKPLRYLALSTRQTVEVVGYPDSKKIGVIGAGTGWSYADKAWVRLIVRDGTVLDYYDGETTD